MSSVPRVVLATREPGMRALLARHGTRQQAAFFLAGRGRDLGDVERADTAVADAVSVVSAALPAEWRRVVVWRDDLARFLFAPDDIVVVVGQDGLVANVAKYLDGQPVVGVDPAPGTNPGVLVRHRAANAGRLLRRVAAGTAPIEHRTMVRCSLDDGQHLDALNEIYLGHPSHQSARYTLRTDAGTVERHSSSGVLVGTGTGATGWCRSVWAERRSRLRLPEPTACGLAWFVREAWPSPTTGTDLTEGLLEPGASIELTAESDLVAFGDGIEADRLTQSWGQTARLSVSPRQLALVGGPRT